MSTQFSLNRGKMKIRLTIEGCYKCGSIGSFAWGYADEIPVKIGNKEGTIPVIICGDCMNLEHTPVNSNPGPDDIPAPQPKLL